MIQEVSKGAKVALCRKCHGTGRIVHVKRDDGAELPRTEQSVCPQCEGSGRVTVSCKMTLDIRPYKIR